MPDEVQRFARDLADQLVATASMSLVGVYVHGSAVLGDFQPTTSDVDVLVVIRDGTPRRIVEQIATVLAADGRCPGAGLEASVVDESAARTPAAPWPYRVHVTTVSSHRKTVWCEPGGGDVDLILHYAVIRGAGWAVYGPRPADAIGPVARSVIARQLAVELRWAVDHANESYTVLNACRALRFAFEDVLCSKTAGGTWALGQGVEEELIDHALKDRRRGHSGSPSRKAVEFTSRAVDALEECQRAEG